MRQAKRKRDTRSRSQSELGVHARQATCRPRLRRFQRYKFSFHRPALAAVVFLDGQIAVGRMRLDDSLHCRLVAFGTQVVEVKVQRHDTNPPPTRQQTVRGAGTKPPGRIKSRRLLMAPQNAPRLARLHLRFRNQKAFQAHGGQRPIARHVEEGLSVVHRLTAVAQRRYSTANSRYSLRGWHGVPSGLQAAAQSTTALLYNNVLESREGIIVGLFWPPPVLNRSLFD
jgi:hypothetical protein